MAVNVEQRIYDTNLNLFTNLLLMKQNLKRCINRKITVEDMLDILRDSVEKFNKYRKLESIDYTNFLE